MRPVACLTSTGNTAACTTSIPLPPGRQLEHRHICTRFSLVQAHRIPVFPSSRGSSGKLNLVLMYYFRPSFQPNSSYPDSGVREGALDGQSSMPHPSHFTRLPPPLLVSSRIRPLSSELPIWKATRPICYARLPGRCVACVAGKMLWRKFAMDMGRGVGMIISMI